VALLYTLRTLVDIKLSIEASALLSLRDKSRMQFPMSPFLSCKEHDIRNRGNIKKIIAIAIMFPLFSNYRRSSAFTILFPKIA